MAKTETFTKLLDRASTPLQTHIILAQLKILRQQDRLRNQRGEASTFAMVLLTVTMLAVWTCVARVIAIGLGNLLPFGH